ncbi:MAG: hypothetical protein RQ743_13670, partial [Bacteroidales bacterium]|nr:hypothetical protein [Bacteroidales bacterium]
LRRTKPDLCRAVADKVRSVPGYGGQSQICAGLWRTKSDLFRATADKIYFTTIKKRKQYD